MFFLMFTKGPEERSTSFPINLASIIHYIYVGKPYSRGSLYRVMTLPLTCAPDVPTKPIYDSIT